MPLEQDAEQNTAAQDAGHNAAPPKRQRSIKYLFCSVVLALELLLLIFAGLGLWRLHDNQVFLLLCGAFVVLNLAALALLRRGWGYYIGWFYHTAMVVGFITELPLLLTVLGFYACWAYAFFKGGKMDAENVERARLEAEYQARNSSAAPHPDTPTESTKQ